MVDNIARLKDNEVCSGILFVLLCLFCYMPKQIFLPQLNDCIITERARTKCVSLTNNPVPYCRHNSGLESFMC